MKKECEQPKKTEHIVIDQVIPVTWDWPTEMHLLKKDRIYKEGILYSVNTYNNIKYAKVIPINPVYNSWAKKLNIGAGLVRDISKSSVFANTWMIEELCRRRYKQGKYIIKSLHTLTIETAVYNHIHD